MCTGMIELDAQIGHSRRASPVTFEGHPRPAKDLIFFNFTGFLRNLTRMHSSRMRTARSSSRRGGLVLIPLNFPLGCWPGPDPPQFPPWVWAWISSPSISPLGVGLDLIPLNFPLGCGPGSDPPQFPPWVWAWI